MNAEIETCIRARYSICGFVLVSLAAINGCSHMPGIHEAAVTGDLHAIQVHLDRGVPVECLDEYDFGCTPLLWAAMAGNERSARFLLDHGANPNARQMEPLTTFDDEGIREITEPGPSVLHYAASSGDGGLVKLLLERGANVALALRTDGTGRCGETALHWAASRAVAELLIAGGADPRAKTPYGETPLHAAASGGHSDVAELLIENKAEIEARDHWEQTPLMAAAERGHFRTVEVLVGLGADMTAKDDDGMTALHEAARELRYDAVRVLLAQGAPVDAGGPGGATPLHLAAGDKEPGRVGNLPAFNRPPDTTRGKLVELLVAHGADVNARDGGCGATPLHRAVYSGHAEAIQALIKGGANVDARTSRTPSRTSFGHADMTPLHWAALHGRVEAARLLLHAGADVNARDNNGRTPLALAESEEMKTLLKKCHGRE